MHRLSEKNRELRDDVKSLKEQVKSLAALCKAAEAQVGDKRKTEAPAGGGAETAAAPATKRFRSEDDKSQKLTSDMGAAAQQTLAHGSKSSQ